MRICPKLPKWPKRHTNNFFQTSSSRRMRNEPLQMRISFFFRMPQEPVSVKISEVLLIKAGSLPSTDSIRFVGEKGVLQKFGIDSG